MEATVLKVPPLSGDMEELQFDAFGTCTWVKFLDDDQQEFCGVFGGGDGNRSAVAALKNRALVVSLGLGYILDLSTRTVVHKTDCEHLTGVIAVEPCNLFVAHDFTNLLVYRDDLIWTSHRVSMDGIKLEGVDGKLVHGKVFNLESWVSFTLDSSTLDFVCDWRCPFD